MFFKGVKCILYSVTDLEISTVKRWSVCLRSQWNFKWWALLPITMLALSIVIRPRLVLRTSIIKKGQSFLFWKVVLVHKFTYKGCKKKRNFFDWIRKVKLHVKFTHHHHNNIKNNKNILKVVFFSKDMIFQIEWRQFGYEINRTETTDHHVKL